MAAGPVGGWMQARSLAFLYQQGEQRKLSSAGPWVDHGPKERSGRPEGEEISFLPCLRKIHPAPSIRTWEHTDIRKSQADSVLMIQKDI